MHLDLLFLPLLGGYIFYTKFAFTAYRANRIDKERLIFNSAACGLIMLIAAKLLVDVSPLVSKNAGTLQTLALSALPTFCLVCSYKLADAAINMWRRAGVKAFFSDSRGIVTALCASALTVEAWCFWRVLSQSLAAWIVPVVLSAAVLIIAALLSSNSRRIEVENAIYHAALFGVLFCIGTYFFDDRIASIQEWWKIFSPIDSSGIPFIAFLLGACLWWPLNVLIPYSSALAWLHDTGATDAMDAFLHGVAEDKALVQLSLSDGKFYIGNIRQLPANPAAKHAYVRILPMISGYRDEKKELNFTSFYQDVYDDLIKSPNFQDGWLNEFVKLVPIESIASANRFDPRMYIRFSRERREPRGSRKSSKRPGKTGDARHRSP